MIQTLTLKRRRLLLAATGLLAGAASAVPAAPRLLHVMSYHGDWQWNIDQLAGFRETLALPEAPWRVVELDAKRVSPAEVARRAEQADALVAQWQPHLIYTNDDIAQSAFGVRWLDRGPPMVYSGVNKEPADYGFDRARNVSGVLEREHFLGTLTLLREVLGRAPQRIALVFDDDPTWLGVARRIRSELANAGSLQVTHWLQPTTLQDYQRQLLALHGQVDAVGLLGIFRFRDGNGFAPYEQVLRWTAAHSQLPDFSFWDTRVERGTLCAMTVDGVEQGRQAGRIARRILVDGVPPHAIEQTPTARGRPMLSLARARALGLRVDSGVLLRAKVLTDYAWER